MEESKSKKITNWIQDSLQAIIVIILTLLILILAIYFYAKKANHKDVALNDQSSNGDVIDEIEDENGNKQGENSQNGENSTNNSENNAEGENSENSNNSQNGNENSTNQNSANNSQNNDEQNAEGSDRGKGPVNSEESVEKKENVNSQNQEKNNTDGEITLTVNRGDSLTTLARKATNQYISENNVEGLTPAHKIYIEDYLQKRVKDRNLQVGSSVSFSKEAINSAIQSAKSLNDKQIQHLNKYTKHVSGL